MRRGEARCSAWITKFRKDGPSRGGMRRGHDIHGFAYWEPRREMDQTLAFRGHRRISLLMKFFFKIAADVDNVIHELCNGRRRVFILVTRPCDGKPSGCLDLGWRGTKMGNAFEEVLYAAASPVTSAISAAISAWASSAPTSSSSSGAAYSCFRSCSVVYNQVRTCSDAISGSAAVSASSATKEHSSTASPPSLAVRL